MDLALEYHGNRPARTASLLVEDSAGLRSRPIEDAVFVEIAEDLATASVGSLSGPHQDRIGSEPIPHAPGSSSITTGLALQAAHLYGSRMHRTVSAEGPGADLLRLQQTYRRVSRLQTDR
jgi:hypothetical protein